VPLAKLIHGPSGLSSQRVRKIPGPPHALALASMASMLAFFPNRPLNLATAADPPHRPMA